jgi:hypothetical protein
MIEPEKRVNPEIIKSDQPPAVSFESQLGEIVNILKRIDDKLEIIARAVRDINARG